MAPKQSKPTLTTDEQHSLAVNGMALRVKYRKCDDNGKALKVKFPLGSLGVHPKNRGGVYPAGIRCKSLCMEVADVGFLRESVEHCCVVVEEMPIDIARSLGSTHESGSAYNLRQSKKDEFLKSCFAAPYNDVRGLLLSHNHMMLILRAFLAKALWHLPANAAKGITLCDAEGKLSISAVAGHPNLKQLAETLTEGIEVELLSCNMDIEEPSAASIISQSLNIEQELALRTSELTAVAVLKGEMIVQMGKDFSQKVVYKSVIAKVRQELKISADDPDLPDVFDYLRSLGVGKNTYVDRLLQFGAAFVDSKKRQLRFSAFAIANKINHDYPLTRVAVIERSYQKKPSNGFCPNPEIQWGEIQLGFLSLLEQMLFYFHTTRRVDVDKLEPAARNKFLANVDCSATNAFFPVAATTVQQKKNKHRMLDDRAVKDVLLESMQKYFDLLGEQQAAVAERREEHGENSAAVADENQTAAVANWIVFKVATGGEDGNQGTSTESANNVPSSAANIPQFDEQTGARLTAEEGFPELDTQTEERSITIVLPWRKWHKENALGTLEADRAAAVAVLHGLHENFDVTTQAIDIIYTARTDSSHSKPNVVALKTIEAGALWLPACVPKQSRVVETSENPNAVPLRVTVLRSAESAVNSPEGHIVRFRDFKIQPEFKIPTKASAGSKPAVADEDGWIFDDGTPDTMHPFWAVRRLTSQQLEKERNETKPGKWLPRFSCQLVDIELSNVCVYSRISCANSTRNFKIPFLTNSAQLEEGEELILQVATREKAAKPKARTWRQVEKDAEKTEKSPAKAPKQK